MQQMCSQPRPRSSRHCTNSGLSASAAATPTASCDRTRSFTAVLETMGSNLPSKARANSSAGRRTRARFSVAGPPSGSSTAWVVKPADAASSRKPSCVCQCRTHGRSTTVVESPSNPFVAQDGRLSSAGLVAFFRDRGHAEHRAVCIPCLSGLAELRGRCRRREEQWDQCGPVGCEVLADPHQRPAGGVVIRNEVEGGAGQEDRPVTARQLHAIHRLVMQHDGQALPARRVATSLQHVGRRVQPLDVEPPLAADPTVDRPHRSRAPAPVHPTRR